MFQLKQHRQTSFCGGAEQSALLKTAAIAGDFAAFSSARGLALSSVKAEILSCQRARKLLDGVGGGWVHQNHSSIKIFRLQDAVRPATPRQAVQSLPFDYPQSREALERRSIQTLQLAEATRSAPVIDTTGSQSVLLNKL
jgi:hypothetical protein